MIGNSTEPTFKIKVLAWNEEKAPLRSPRIFLALARDCKSNFLPSLQILWLGTRSMICTSSCTSGSISQPESPAVLRRSCSGVAAATRGEQFSQPSTAFVSRPPSSCCLPVGLFLTWNQKTSAPFKRAIPWPGTSRHCASFRVRRGQQLVAEKNGIGPGQEAEDLQLPAHAVPAGAEANAGPGKGDARGGDEPNQLDANRPARRFPAACRRSAPGS